MDRNAHYEELKELARNMRERHDVQTARLGLREVRQIYKAEKVDIHYWPLPPKIKAIYMCDDGYCSVAVQKKLPDEPKLFALVHELKHHYMDQEVVMDGGMYCGDYNQNEIIEIGAEVFAAEFIYPEEEFAADIALLGIGTWTPEDVVHLKRGCKAKVSYMYLQKRLERLGLIERGQFAKVKFKKLEEQLYGVPFYKRKHQRH